VESKAGASNGQYNITVNKLATTSKFEGTFDSSTAPLATEDGTLTFTAGDKKFNIEKINGDGSVAHSIAILDNKTIVSNSDNKIEIDYATNTIILKNKKGWNSHEKANSGFFMTWPSRQYRNQCFFL